MANSQSYHDKATEMASQEGRLKIPNGNAQNRLTPTTSHASRRSDLSRVRSHVDGHGFYHSGHSSGDEGRPDSKEVDQNDFANEKSYKEVTWDSPEDPMNPKNFPTWRKWMIVIVLAFGSLCVTCTSSIYTFTYDQMDVEFGNSRIVATLGLALFVFGLGLAPMLLGPLSEFFGRRPIYVIGFAMFLIWLIPCAVSQNIQTMLIARFFDGLAGSAFLSVAGGTVGDMFTKETLTGPMIIYSAAPFLGPGIGPVIGGFINYNISWRWTWYVLLIWASVVLVVISILVPETYAPVVLRDKAKKKRAETGDESWKAKLEVSDKSILRTVVGSLYRPFFILFLDPMCFCLCLFSAILLGILYLFFGAFPLVFSEVYDFNLWQNGLAFLGILTGMLIAIMSDPIWHYLYLHQLDGHERKFGQRGSEPEYRLPSSIVGAWFCVIGLFWFA